MCIIPRSGLDVRTVEVGEGGNREIERGPMDQLLGSVAGSMTGGGVREKES